MTTGNSIMVDRATSDAARTRLQAARAHAISALTPYFGNALSSMVMHEVPGLGTVATDTRWRLYYDPEAVASWSLGECAAAWLHELKHNLHRHGDRFEALNRPPAMHHIFNIAADALINEDLRDLMRWSATRSRTAAAMEMAGDWIYLSSLPVKATREMSAEQIFALLEDSVQPCPVHGQGASGSGPDGSDRPGQGPQGASENPSSPENCTCTTVSDCGSGAGSGHSRWWELPDSDGSDGSVDKGRGDLIIHDAARQVVAHAKERGRGFVPVGMQRWAEAELESAVDWREQLRSLVSGRCAAVAGRRDYTYSRPSRRTASRGIILPSMREPAPPNGAVVLDTSGSMTDQELAQGLAEISAILKQVSRGKSTLHVISCDARAAEAEAVRSVRDLTLVGGGGTDMRVGMQAAASLRPSVDFVVVFTDGDTPWPERPPEMNAAARYIAVLSDGPRGDVPDWMRCVVVDPRRS